MAFSFGNQSTPGFGGFGAAASTPQPFGAASTPAFGAAASTAPFGVSTPAFGAAGGSSSLFGASTTPAFGAAPATTSLFGAASTPSLFGAAPATSAPSLFGAAPATSAPSLFGAAPASSTPSLFGAPAASSALPMFGAATAQPPANTGAFGLALAPPASTPFGGPGGSMWGAQQQQQQQQPLVLGAAGAPPASDTNSVLKEIMEIKAAYDPASSSFRFGRLLLNVVDNPAARVRPAGVDELRWKQALKEAGGADNAQHLWPVLAQGFGDLLKRAAAQEEALAEHRQRSDALRDLASKLARRQDGELQVRAATARTQHRELSSRLLALSRHVDGLEARLAMYMGSRGEMSRAKDAALSKALDRLEAELSSAGAGGIQHRLDALAAAGRLRGSGGGAVARDALSARLDPESLQQLHSVLREHVEGVKQLQEVLRRDILDVEILRGAHGLDNGAPNARLSTAVLEAL